MQPDEPATLNPGADDTAALKEIYTHVHKEMMDLRTLVYHMTTFQVGVCGLLSSWLASRSSVDQKLAFVAVIGTAVVAFGMLYFLRRLETQFNEKASVIARVEVLWGGFEVGRFGLRSGRFGLKVDEALLPLHWRKFGTPEWPEPLFLIARSIIVGSSLFLGGTAIALMK